jgi:hypothetical protein
VSSELERVETTLKTTGTLDEMDLETLATELGAMPEHSSRSALERIATELGQRSVPLLEALALGARESLAKSAVRSLSKIREQTAALALQRVSMESSSNAVKKAARREIHTLASLGVHPPKAAAQVPKKSKKKIAPVEVLGSPIDGLGDRAFWLAFGEGADIDLLGLVLNEEKGIVDAFSTDMSRSRFNREADRVRQHGKLPWVDIPVDYCRHLIEEAHNKNRSTGHLLPLEYITWRDRIGRPERVYERPLVYEVINVAEIRWDPRYLDSSDELLDQELFQSWLLPQDELAPFLREREVIHQSGLVLAGMNQEAREGMVVDRAIQTLFDAKRRSLFKRRLEETAYLLWKLERPVTAKAALAAALAMEPPESPLIRHPFIRRLMEWNLDVMEAIMRGEKTRDIKPGVHLHLPY